MSSQLRKFDDIYYGDLEAGTLYGCIRRHCGLEAI